MKDPQRLLIGDGTALERELLRSVLDEPVPLALHARMLAALPLTDVPVNPGFEPTTTGVNAGGSSIGGAAVGKAGTAAVVKVGSGALLKTLVVSLGVGSALTAGWIMTQPRSEAPSSIQTKDTTPAAQVIEPAPANRPALANPTTPAKQPALVDPATPMPAADEASPNVGLGEPAQAAQTSPHIRRATKTAAVTLPEASPIAATPEPDVGHPPAANPIRVSPTLSAELKLLDAARGAIQRGDTQRSLQVLDTYARQFPQGELAHEAKVLRGLAQRADK